MRYLIILLILFSLQSIAQPALEFGINGGAVLPTATSYMGYTISIGGDLVTGRFRRKLTPAFGVRTSLFLVRTKELTLNSGYTMAPDIVTWTSIALPVSVNYVTPLSDNCNLRLTACAGPAGDFTGTSGNSELFLLTEASTGLMFNKKTTVGVKFTYPTGFFGHDAKTAFRVHALQLDAKFMIPRGRVIAGKSQWQRLKERNAEMAIRHKEMKEEKRNSPGKGPRLQMGLTGGIGFTNRTGNPNDGLFLFTADIALDRHQSPISFTWGARLGVLGEIPGIGFHLGAKYERPESKSVKPRIGLTIGGWMLDNTVKFTSVQFNVISELTAGLVVGQRFYFGFNYFQPFFKLEKGYMPSSSYIRFYDYKFTGIAADLKIRLGKR